MHSVAELDLFFIVNGKRYGVEIKWNDAPGKTRAMHIAMTDLKLERLFVVCPGKKGYLLGKNIEVVPSVKIHSVAKTIA